MNRAIVTGCNLAFLEGAKAALRSCRRFQPDVARYCYAPAAEAAAVQAGLGELGTVVTAPRELRVVPAEWKPQLMAARVFMAHLPADATAWIDSDAIFCRPAPELWDVKPGRVHAVRDAVYTLGRMVPAEAWDGFAAAFGRGREEPGFNSGVMAVRNADWTDLPERFEAAVGRVGYKLYPHGFDQPLLNGILLPFVDWLPRPFNVHAAYELGIPADTRVLHFTDNPKPWMPAFDRLRPGYYEWVAYGLGEERPLPLAAARIRGWLSGPATLAAKAVRKAKVLATGRRPAVGVSEDGTFLPTRLADPAEGTR